MIERLAEVEAAARVKHEPVKRIPKVEWTLLGYVEATGLAPAMPSYAAERSVLMAGRPSIANGLTGRQAGGRR